MKKEELMKQYEELKGKGKEPEMIFLYIHIFLCVCLFHKLRFHHLSILGF